MQSRFPVAYWGSIGYFQQLEKAKNVCLEINEHYVKQTLRNRTYILSPNKIQALTIPVVKINGNKTLMKDILISHHEKWEKEHLNALLTAYSSSPYYEHYIYEIEPLYHQEWKSLVEFHSTCIALVKEWLSLDFEVKYSDSYDLIKDEFDFRKIEETPVENCNYHYHQVFNQGNSFIGNLSILDALFNLGPMTRKLFHF